MTLEDDIHEAASEWRLRREHGLTPAQDEAFRRWRGDPANARAYEAVSRVWRAFDDISAPELELVRRRARRLRTTGRRTVMMRVAATLLVLVLLGGGWGLMTLDRGERHAAPDGGVQEVRLDDGSLVVLDSGAVLRARFTRDGRNLRLEQGQARFVVASDPRRPFHVDVGEDRVTAVGTIFNIALGRDRATVTLIEGLVDVSAKPKWFGLNRAGDTIRLEPGQQVVLGAAAPWTVTQVRTEEASIWSRQMNFSDVALGDAVEHVNRYADVPVLLAGSGLADLRVSGAFHHGDSRGFAQGVARLYGLTVIETEGGFMLRSERSG